MQGRMHQSFKKIQADIKKKKWKSSITGLLLDSEKAEIKKTVL